MARGCGGDVLSFFLNVCSEGELIGGQRFSLKVESAGGQGDQSFASHLTRSRKYGDEGRKRV
jgi:hypothetical protein